MSMFEKVASNSEKLKKYALLGLIVRNPLKAIGAAFTASEMKSTATNANKAIRDSKNRIRADLSSTLSKV